MKLLLQSVIVLTTATAAFGQDPQRAVFEVASVRPSGADGSNGGVTPGQDGITAHGASLFLLIRVAYNLQDYQISGPAWLRDQRYDIAAKASGPVSQDTLRTMLQSLLAERFKLSTHRESQERSVYALVPVPGGHRLRQSKEGTRGGTSAEIGRLVFTGATMPGLALRLTQILSMPVVDSTGLAGPYDFTLEWQQDDNAPGISLFTALQEQLGLKLEPRRVAVDVLVIDRAERVPTEN